MDAAGFRGEKNVLVTAFCRFRGGAFPSSPESSVRSMGVFPLFLPPLDLPFVGVLGPAVLWDFEKNEDMVACVPCGADINTAERPPSRARGRELEEETQEVVASA